MLLIRTARVSYRGPDRFDITRKSGGAEGRVFAPSWKILGPALDARREAKRIVEHANAEASYLAGERVLRHGTTEVRCEFPLPAAECERIREKARKEAAQLELGAWSTYVPEYLEEMMQSRDRHPAAWEALLARERVVLCCYCPVTPRKDDGERCHRILLAELLASMGARYEGEIVAADKPPVAIGGRS